MKFRYENKEDIPEGLEASYPAANGGYELILEGGPGPDNTKLDEMRTNNRKLAETKQALESELGRLKKDAEKFNSEEFEGYRSHLEKIQGDEDEADLKAGKYEAVFERRRKQEREAAAAKYAEKAKAYDELKASEATLKARHTKHVTVGRIQAALSAADLRIRKGALDNVNLQIASDWQIDDKDKMIPNNLFGESGEPMTEKEYGKHLLENKSFFFEPAKGGGSGGGSKTAVRDGVLLISKDDAVAISMHTKDIATGKAKVV
jgi:hypothetical protein